MSEPTREELLAEVKWLRGVMRLSAGTLTGATDGGTDVRVAREVVKATAGTLRRAADDSERSGCAPR